MSLQVGNRLDGHDQRSIGLEGELLSTMGAKRGRIIRMLYPDVADSHFDRIWIKDKAALLYQRSNRFLIDLDIAAVVDSVWCR